MIKIYRTTFFISSILVVALLQVHSLWDLHGEQVDESEMYHYAIGFFGGNLDPGWYGYSVFGMYLLSAVFWLAAQPLIFVGKFVSLHEYAMQLYYNDYFLLLSRYVFAVIGVVSVFIYARLARAVDIPLGMVVLFLLISLTSKDAIHFANYIRTDQLVSMFVAISIGLAAYSNHKRNMFLLGPAVAAAVASKISALPLVVLWGFYLILRWRQKNINWKEVSFLIAVFVLVLAILSPFHNPISRIFEIINTRSRGMTTMHWGKEYFYSPLERLHEIWRIIVRYCTLPVVLCLPLIVFSKPYIKVVFPAVLSLILLTLPYMISREVTYYWFVPVFNLIRFLALISLWASLIVLIQWSTRYFGYRFVLNRELVSIAVFGIAFVFVIIPASESYGAQFRWTDTNIDIAERQILNEYAEHKRIALEGHINHIIPKIYDRNNLSASQSISRAFIFNRIRNPYLVGLFNQYVSKHYYEINGIDRIAGVQRVHAFDPRNQERIEKLRGAYWVTSPTVYSTFLGRSAHDLDESRRNELDVFKRHYQFMLCNPLIDRFDGGRGPVVEIYRLDFECSSDSSG